MNRMEGLTEIEGSDLFDLAKSGKLAKENLVGVDIFQRRKNGLNLLECAATNNQEKCVKLLLELIWLRGYSDWTPFHAASFYGRESIVKLLLKSKLVKTGYGDTPFKVAERWNRVNIMKTIVCHDEKEKLFQDVFPLTFLQI